MELNKIDRQCIKALSGYDAYAVSGIEPAVAPVLMNALRRVLLSSMAGCAISRINIAGIAHEFSSAPGVHEDITQIVTNLKGVYIHTDDYFEGERTACLTANGPCAVTAKDIDTKDPSIRIVNPEKPLFSIEEGYSLSMTITLTCGRGTSLAASRDNEHSSIGDIEIDALYNPVQAVNFEILDDTAYIRIRTNKSTDSDRLIASAAHILTKHLEAISEGISAPQRDYDICEQDVPVQSLSLPPETTIEELWQMGLPGKIFAVLKRNHINSLEALTGCSAESLLKLHGFGPARLKLLNEFLNDFSIEI